jgi:hypothetical protein
MTAYNDTFFVQSYTKILTQTAVASVKSITNGNLVTKLAGIKKKFSPTAGSSVTRTGDRGSTKIVSSLAKITRFATSSVPPDFVDPPSGFNQFSVNDVQRFSLNAYERFTISDEGDI